MPRKLQYLQYPMRIQARQGSLAEKMYYVRSALPSAWQMPAAIAPGISPAPLEDLIFHGGKIVPQMEFQNIYLGGAPSWGNGDIESIDGAINLAMRDKRLNNVMSQYFHQARLSCEMRESFIDDGANLKQLGESDVKAIMERLFDDQRNLIKRTDLGSTIFNLILPAGVILKLGNSSSSSGLGGYHGSLHIKRSGKAITLYYSANVYSEMQKDGKENGISAFDKPWKNIVGTLYHEINEFRTDADVDDAIQNNSNDFLGWNSRNGHEVGDQPIFAAAHLKQVFKEVQTAGKKRIPIQLMYSNAVHGAEGPIAEPHA